MDRSAGMLKLSRRLDGDFRVLRYDRSGYGRSFPHPGPFTMERPGGRPRRTVGWSAGGADRAQLRRQRRAGDGGSSSRSGRRRGGVRDAIVVGAVVARHDGRFDRRGRAREPKEAAERFMRRMLGDQRWEALPERSEADTPRRRVWRWSESWPICGGNQPWVAEEHHRAGHQLVREPSRAPHHRRGMRHAATLLGCPVVEYPIAVTMRR